MLPVGRTLLLLTWRVTRPFSARCLVPCCPHVYRPGLSDLASAHPSIHPSIRSRLADLPLHIRFYLCRNPWRTPLPLVGVPWSCDLVSACVKSIPTIRGSGEKVGRNLDSALRESLTSGLLEVPSGGSLQYHQAMTESGRGPSPLDEICQHLAALTQAVKTLQEGYTHLENRMQAMTAPAIPPPASVPTDATGESPGPSGGAAAVTPAAHEPRVPLPDRFRGDLGRFRAFRNACQLYFRLQPHTFTSEDVKVGFIISLLQDEPQDWAHQLMEDEDPRLGSVKRFFEAMAVLYDDPQRRASAETALHTLRQGRRAAEEYTAEFRRLMGSTKWNEFALCHQYRLGLSETLKDELARVDLPESLEGLFSLTIKVDRRLRERKWERGNQGQRFSWGPNRGAATTVSEANRSSESRDAPEPMQLGLTHPPLTAEERQRRRTNNLCLYCGEAGHMVRSCPLKAGKSASSIPSVSARDCSRSGYLAVPVVFQLPGRTVEVSAIIDSGACGCFIDLTFAHEQNIPLQRKERGLDIFLADGSRIKSGRVDRETPPLFSVTLGHHREFLRLDAITSPLFPIILGLPWLQAHNPQIDWETGAIRFSSHYCREHCHASGPNTPQLLICTEGDPQLKQAIPTAYHGYLDVFSKRGADTLPPHRPYDCPIDLLPGSEIPFGRIFPLSELELGVLKDYIDENLEKGFIRPSTSPAGAGIFFVEKKDKSLRPCIDYRELNKVTIKNRYPLPLVPELFQRLKSTALFTKLDLRGAYNLVRIREGDEWKTAFRTRFGHFEYLVMPFGLCNAPATFQHFINDVFRDYLDIFVVVYLDDILIFSPSLEVHRGHVRCVLDRLRQHGLYAKADKCCFEQHSITFLGLIISTTGVAMDPQKVSAILEWPVPTDKKGVQRFIGFANFYRKFIRNFSGLVSPITQLTKQGVRFHWTPEAQRAFEALKKLFTSAPILGHPDSSLPYVLEVDASENAVGAILSQRKGTKELLHPVAFFSRKLTPAEKNYDIGDRELLAIKTALEEWRYLLEGATHPILIFTDHKNLEYLRTAKRLRPRQARWALFFSRFTFHITYRPGSKNTKPDALSRMFEDPKETLKPDTILSAGNFLALQTELHSRLQEAARNEPSAPGTGSQDRHGLVRKDGLIVVPEEARISVLGHCHDHPMAGHFGVAKTLELLRRTYWWPSLSQDCELYVKSCAICQRNKPTRNKAWGLLRPLPIPDRPWQRISMDFIVELPSSGGHTAIFVIVDRLTKMAHFVPLKSTPSAAETSQVFIREVVRLHGVPEDIVSDRGVQFTSKFWKALCEALKIQLSLSSAYHPQTNGQTERTNQTLEQYLRCYTSFLQDDWITLLPMAEFAYNNAMHAATGQSPFFSNYGYHPTFLPDVVAECSVPASQITLEFFSANNKLLQEAIAKAQVRNKKAFDKKRRDLLLQPGDRVWLATTNLKIPCPSRKLGPKFLGPFRVKRMINEVAYELDLPESFKIHPVFHVSLLKPAVADPFPDRASQPPEAVVIEDQEEFEVEAILNCRVRGGQTQFLIKWKGYGPEENSWEPAQNVHAPRLVREFYRSHPRWRSQLGTRRLPVGRGQCQAPSRASSRRRRTVPVRRGLRTLGPGRPRQAGGSRMRTGCRGLAPGSNDSAGRGI